jgi:hypothetical protein
MDLRTFLAAFIEIACQVVKGAQKAMARRRLEPMARGIFPAPRRPLTPKAPPAATTVRTSPGTSAPNHQLVVVKTKKPATSAFVAAVKFNASLLKARSHSLLEHLVRPENGSAEPNACFRANYR